MAKTRVKISDSKKKWNQLYNTMQMISGKGMSVFVGILEEDFNEKHPESNATYGEIAVFNELGTSKVPARSFIRAPFDAHNGYEKLRNSLLKRVISGTYTMEQAMNILGSAIAKSFIKYVNDGSNLRANEDSTIEKKLSDKPLIDSGALIGDKTAPGKISYKITK